MQQCAKTPHGLADWYCAVAHYVYAASCDTCEDVEGVLERLASEGVMPFQDMAKVRLPRVHCEQGKLTAAVQGLVALDDAWDRDGCRYLALTGPAMCVLSRSDDSLDGPALERMKRLAGLEGLDSCDAPGRALVISERAWWHYQHGQWQQAAEDWYQAWQLDPRVEDYLLNWAEALLRQRRDRTDVARLIGQQLKPESIEGDQHSRAAFLRWVATRDRDDANILYSLYENAREGEQVLRSGAVDRGVCEEPDSDAVCRVYDILTVSKRAADRDQLRELLFPAGGG
jgi:tetratricopeptide (TPR) repeat protein